MIMSRFEIEFPVKYKVRTMSHCASDGVLGGIRRSVNKVWRLEASGRPEVGCGRPSKRGRGNQGRRLGRGD